MTPEVEAAWQKAQDAWDDAAAHDRFLELAAVAAELPWAARQYRAYLKDHPDDVRATAALDRITKMALATMFATATRRPEKTQTPYRNTLIVLALLVFLIVVGVLYASLTSASRDAENPRPRVHHK